MPLGQINPFRVGQDASASILGAAPGLISSIVATSSANIRTAANNAIQQENLIARGNRENINRADRIDQFNRGIFESDRNFIDKIVQDAIGNDQRDRQLDQADRSLDIRENESDVRVQGQRITNELNAFELGNAPEDRDFDIAESIFKRQESRRLNDSRIKTDEAQIASSNALAEQRRRGTGDNPTAAVEISDLNSKIKGLEAGLASYDNSDPTRKKSSAEIKMIAELAEAKDKLARLGGSTTGGAGGTQNPSGVDLSDPNNLFRTPFNTPLN